MPGHAKKKILFVCIGNSCRSQMAEAFARQYGSDVVIPASAGLMPAAIVAPDTYRAMIEKNIDLRDHFPKHVRQLGRAHFDLVVNMSGADLRDPPGKNIISWDVTDPICETYERHCEIRDEIERLVVNLVLEIRREVSPKGTLASARTKPAK
jgi:arsenate reductase (thioredoxin)